MSSLPPVQPPNPRPTGEQEGMAFDYANWLERANAFTARWDDEPPRVAAPPACSDNDLAVAERALGRPLPYSVEQFLRQCGYKNGFKVSVEHEGETVLIGGTEWDITNLVEDMAWCRKIAGECRGYGQADQAEFLDQALPLLAASNGDFIALDLRDTNDNPSVGYFAHADDSWPFLANSLSDFLMQWERCCYAGPEWWTLKPFRDANGLLSGDTEAATALRQRLGGGA